MGVGPACGVAERVIILKIIGDHFMPRVLVGPFISTASCPLDLTDGMPHPDCPAVAPTGDNVSVKLFLVLPHGFVGKEFIAEAQLAEGILVPVAASPVVVTAPQGIVGPNGQDKMDSMLFCI